MISKEKQYFLKKIIALCLIISILSIILFSTVLKAYYLNAFPFQVGIIALVTIFSHLKLMNAQKKNARGFSTVFLSTMSMKLFVYLVFILVSLIIDKSKAINFVLTFFILYLLFTSFEVNEITNFLKKNQNSSN